MTSDFYGYEIESWDWSKKVVWSNLYKIAEDRANPSLFLREQQLPISAELIKREIEELKPKYCIVLTNYKWWKPFQKLLGTRPASFDKSFSNIEAVEHYLDTKITITTRPRYGSGESHVEQIKKVL